MADKKWWEMTPQEAQQAQRDKDRNRSKEIQAHMADMYGIHSPTAKELDYTPKEKKSLERGYKRQRPSDFSGKGAQGVRTYGTDKTRRGGNL